MNVRSLIKLKDFTLINDYAKNGDNPYTYKIEIWHGDEVHPYHESAPFTKEELSSWLLNVSKLYNYLISEIKYDENNT